MNPKTLKKLPEWAEEYRFFGEEPVGSSVRAVGGNRANGTWFGHATALISYYCRARMRDTAGVDGEHVRGTG